MCWMCDHPGSTKEEYLAVLHTKILSHGWAVQYVEDDRAPFAYTIGLTRHGLPELLVTGVSPERALHLLNDVALSAVPGNPRTPGEQLVLSSGSVVEVVAVEHPDAHLYFAVAFYGDVMRALQLVWTDERGRWPWAADFDDGRGGQPVLGVRATSD